MILRIVIKLKSIENINTFFAQGKTMKKTINKQTEANKKWQKKNKEYAKYLSDRSRARNFIKKKAKITDIEEFSTLLRDRRNELS